MTATDIYEYFKKVAVYGPQRAKRIADSEAFLDFLVDWLMMTEHDLEEGSFIENQNLRTEQFVKEYARIANIDRENTKRLMNEIGSTIALNGSEAVRNKLQDKSIAQHEKEDSEVILKAYMTAEQIRNTNMNELFQIPLQTTGYEDTPSRILLGFPVAAAALEGAKKLFGEERATFIAVNESQWLSNHEEHYEKVNSGDATHTWITMNDERVREAHAEVDGQTVPINEPFIVSGYKMLYPGDNLTDNPPAELILNCRCVEG